MDTATAPVTTLSAQKKVFSDALSAKLKELGDPLQQDALLVELHEVLKKYSRIKAETPEPLVELWDADEVRITKWIRERRAGSKGAQMKIISGLEPIRITSPQDFDSETLDVHMKTDPEMGLYLDVKLSRAVADGSDFGWRELIFCYKNWQKINPSWWVIYGLYFAKAVVEINGVCHVAMLSTDETGCTVDFYPLNYRSSVYERCPVLASSRA